MAAVNARQYAQSSPDKSEEDIEANGADSGGQDPEYNQLAGDDEFKVSERVHRRTEG